MSIMPNIPYDAILVVFFSPMFIIYGVIMFGIGVYIGRNDR